MRDFDHTVVPAVIVCTIILGIVLLWLVLHWRCAPRAWQRETQLYVQCVISQHTLASVLDTTSHLLVNPEVGPVAERD